MQYTQVFALAILFATSAVAAPAPNPPKPPPECTPPKKTHTPRPTPTTVNQTNNCGNNANPYCCNSDGYGYSTCWAMGQGSQCSQTTVCCNANNSIQVCLGNAIITL